MSRQERRAYARAARKMAEARGDKVHEGKPGDGITIDRHEQDGQVFIELGITVGGRRTFVGVPADGARELAAALVAAANGDPAPPNHVGGRPWYGEPTGAAPDFVVSRTGTGEISCRACGAESRRGVGPRVLPLSPGGARDVTIVHATDCPFLAALEAGPEATKAYIDANGDPYRERSAAGVH